MTTRRDFLACLSAAMPVIALPPLSVESVRVDYVPPAVRRSDPEVPRRMDLREADHPMMFDIEVYRHGEKTLRCVAYDLTDDSMVVIAEDRTTMHYERLNGGVTVKWRRA